MKATKTAFWSAAALASTLWVAAPATAAAQDPMDAGLGAQEAGDGGKDWGWIGLLGLAGLLGLRRRDHVDHTTTRNPRV